MTKDFNRFYLSKQMFLGATLLLASVGLATASPATGTTGTALPNPVAASPQQAKYIINGVVEDQFGPIAGANVVEKGTTNGTITDMDGNFTLEVSPNSVLVVSFIGFKEQQIPVNNQKSLRIKLSEDSQALDEVVVVGYGTQKKVNLSGSVTSVNVSEMAESRPLTNISTALAGTAPGVQITSSNNIPSNNGDADIKVRGQGTLNNSSPLVIIDGVEGNLNSVSPQDVETVSVLKDAASSAIYGSRAANGVILITTKSGKAGRMKIDYTGYVSFQSLNKPYDVVTDYASYMEYMNEGMRNSNKPEPFSQNVINLWREKSKDPNGLNEHGIPNYLAYPNSDIFDVYETGVSHQHSLSATGGSEKVTYYTSFNYLNNPGILENCGYERFSLRANIDSQVKDWLKIGVNLSGYTANTTPVSENINDIYTYGLTGGNPGIAYLDDQNRLGINANNEDDPQNATNNPYNRLRNVSGNIGINTLKTRMYAILTPLKGLTIQGSYTYDFYDKQKDSKPNFVPMYNFQTNTLYTDGVGQTSIYNYNEKTYRNFMDAIARYERNYLNNRLSTNIMIGASQEQYKRSYFSATRKDLLDPSLGVIGGAIGESSSTGNITEWAMRSFFGRINLGWDDKYLLEANLRADGSSRFQKDNRWGYFPSFSAAWRISEENFMKATNEWLSNLKLRASWGSIGNQVILKSDNTPDNYPYIPDMNVYLSNWLVDGQKVTTLGAPAMVSSSFGWEKVYTLDFGFDLDLFNNKLNTTFDWYRRDTKGMLAPGMELPGVVGASAAKQNAADLKTYGWELKINWHDRIGDVGYRVGFNLYDSQSEITKYDNEAGLFGKDLYRKGMKLGEIWGYVTDRFYTTDDFNADGTLKPGIPMFKGAGTVYPGDILYKNFDDDTEFIFEGDNTIHNPGDQRIIGNNTPRYQYGITAGVSYKGFDLSIFLRGIGKRDYWRTDQMAWPNGSWGSLFKETLDFWTPDNPDAFYPRVYPQNETNTKFNQKVQTKYLANAAYLKIQNITLSYSLPKNICQKIYMDNIRVFVSGENLHTWDHLPEGMESDMLSKGAWEYPFMKKYSLGINVTF